MKDNPPRARSQEQGGVQWSINTCLDNRNSIILAACIGVTGKRGKPKVACQLEELDERQCQVAQALGILETHLKRKEARSLLFKA